jgi:hypothetical protein
MELTDFLGLVCMTAWIMLQMSWFVIIPAILISLYAGMRLGMNAVWVLLAVCIALGFLIPYTGERGSGGLVYIALPFVIPLYVLPAYGFGQLLRRWSRKPKSYEKDGIDAIY